jgi:hypothetical protein
MRPTPGARRLAGAALLARAAVRGVAALAWVAGCGSGGTTDSRPVDGGTAARDASVVSPGADAGASGPTANDGPSGEALATPPLPGVGGLGAAAFATGDLDPPSNGGTITFEQIGAAGGYPSVRDPAAGGCSAYEAGTCCMAEHVITGDALTPWDEELIMTLRGPMQMKQLAVYQPAMDASSWNLVGGWDDRTPTASSGVAFSGDATPKAAFAGGVGSECLVNVATDVSFHCGPGSEPYCAAGAATNTWGWSGSKLFVVLARMPHAGAAGAPAACSTSTTGNWYDAPWIGLAVGELVRAGSFASCHCFAKDPANWALADGCGQINLFEVVNDNNSYKNLDVFSTDLIDYSGYVGQGPCGSACDAAALPTSVDLIDKANDTAAASGATATPSGGPGAAFRRPEEGYRYFLVLLDVPSRTMQLAIVHPEHIPGALAPLLPALPASIPTAAETALLALRLPM